MRHYVRKGGWGGARSGSGNKPGHWDDQGGRAAAAVAKRERVEEAAQEAERKQRKMKERMSNWLRKETQVIVTHVLPASVPNLSAPRASWCAGCNKAAHSARATRSRSMNRTCDSNGPSGLRSEWAAIRVGCDMSEWAAIRVGCDRVGSMIRRGLRF